jgi:hypothetical protein
VTQGGEVSFVEHTPPPLGIDRDALLNAFISISQSKFASAILEAARAYSSALQLMLTRPELAYQLLISSIETLANTIFGDYQPSQQEMIQHRQGFRVKAREFGLSDEQADALAIEACKGEAWAGRRFRAFFANTRLRMYASPMRCFPSRTAGSLSTKTLKRSLGRYTKPVPSICTRANRFPSG